MIRDGPIVAQANSAVAHLHGVGVAHRDVKPANLLFVDGRHAHGTCTACARRVNGACAACACGMCTAPRPPAAPRQPAPHDGRRRHVKLCDYGFAARCTAVSAAPAEAREKPGRLRTLCGTPAYQAPELRSQSAAGYEGPPVDMWALGAVLYEMLHGRPAFAGETMEVLQHRISKASHAQLAASLSPGPKGLVRSLLQPDPAMRLTAHAVADNSWVGPDRPPGSPPSSPPHAKPAARPAAKPASVAPAATRASSMSASASLPSIGSPSIKVALVASPSLPAHTRAAEPMLLPTHSRSRAKSPHAATAVRAATVAAAAAARAAAARHAAARHAAAARRAAAARDAAAEPIPSAHAVGALPHSHSGGISPRKGKGSPRKGSPRKGSPGPSRTPRRAAAAAGRKLPPRDAHRDSHRLALAQHQAQHQARPGALNAAYARARGEAVTLAAADALAARRLSQLLPALGGRMGAGTDSGAYRCHEAHPVMRRAKARSDGRLRTEPLPACGYGEQSRVLMASAAPPPAYGYGEPARAPMAHSQSAPSMATVTVREHGTEHRHRDGRDGAPPSLDAACAQSDLAHDPSGSRANARANE